MKLAEYKKFSPAPYGWQTRTVGRKTVTVVLDSTGNDVCETFGEDRAEAELAAKLIARSMNETVSKLPDSFA